SAKKGGPIVQASPLDDIHITPDTRTNSLIIAASEDTMQLILALIRELDVPPAPRAEISIFTLKKADAGQLATTLQQLFMGTGATGARPGGLPGPRGMPPAGLPRPAA